MSEDRNNFDVKSSLGWTYDGSSDYSIGLADDPQVNRVALVHSRDPKRGASICNLFAAAPDLLSALKYLLELGGDDDRRIVAEEAIARAEGRTINHFWDAPQVEGMPAGDVSMTEDARPKWNLFSQTWPNTHTGQKSDKELLNDLWENAAHGTHLSDLEAAYHIGVKSREHSHT